MKKFLSLVLALIMVMSLVTVGAGAAFDDADEIQYTEAVEVMAGLGILKGSNGSFDPKGSITRQAAAKIIAYIALGVEDAEKLTCIESPFADVAADATLAPYVAWAAKEGIINGVGDGTNFEPKSPVSGHAFLKMVLGALGIEGTYTGDGWRLNVTTAAAEAELFEGIDTTAVDLRANATRELASQIAFNAMFYSEEETAIQYVVYTNVLDTDDIDEDGDTTEVIGQIVHYEGDNATAAALASVGNAGAVMEQYTVPAGAFAWDNFGLMSNPAYGEFNRPATLYTSTMDDDLEVYVYDTPVLTYENGATDKQIWTDLGYSKATETATLYVTADGDNEADVMSYSKGDTATTVGGNGAVVEVYKASGTRVYDVVVINTYVDKLSEAQIVAAKAATSSADAVPAYIIVEGATSGANKVAYDEDGAFETDAFAKNDYILYTKDGAEIKSVVKAEKVENVKITKYVTNKTVTVGDDTYNYSAKYEGEAKTGFSFTAGYNFILDAQGNIIDMTGVAAAEVDAKYIYVLDVLTDWEIVGEGTNLFDATENAIPVAQARVIDLTTGAISIKNIATVKKTAGWYYEQGSSDEAIDAFVIESTNPNAPSAFEDGAGFYQYVELDDGSIYLVEQTQGSVTLTKDVARIASGVYADSKTALSYVEYTLNEDEEIESVAVTTKTGIANFPKAIAPAEYGYEGTALVIVDEDTDIATNIYIYREAEVVADTVDYAIYKGYVGDDKDGSKYSFYVGGELVEYYVDQSADDNAENDVELTAGTVYDVTMDEDGVVVVLEAKSAKNNNQLTVVAVDETFVLTKNASDSNVLVYFHEDGVAIYDKDASYAVAELAAGDKISVFTSAASGWVDVDLVIIDN